MIDLRIESNTGLAQKFLSNFGKEALRGIRRALQRSLNGMPKDAFESLREEYPLIKASDVRKSFRSYVWGSPPVGQGSFSGNPIPAIRFAPRPAGITRRRPPGGVSIMIKAQRKIIQGSFVAGVKGRVSSTFTKRSAQYVMRHRATHLGVFVRVGRERLPIKQKWGPALPQMLDNEKVREKLIERARERFEKNLAHEIEFAMNK